MAKIRDLIVRAALMLALLLPIYFLVAALGTKFGLIDWKIGFGVMVFRLGSKVVLTILGLGLLALLLALLVRPRRGWKSALVAILIPAVFVATSASMMAKSKDVPPIHDVATNPQDPPTFSKSILDARAEMDANPIEPMTVPLREMPKYKPMASSPRLAKSIDKSVGELGLAANPTVRPLTLAASPAQAFDRALATAKKQGWAVVRQDRSTGAIEATAETFWFGFKDDVAIRIRPAGGGSVVDVRSTSRVGLGDIGANGKRVAKYLAGLKDGAG